MFYFESTEVFIKEVRCFHFSKSLKKAVPTFFSKKKFLKNLLHFLHQTLKLPLYIGDFGCRIGCRIHACCRMYPTFSVFFVPFFRYIGVP